MTELSYALASGQPYAGLSPVERAAAETDLHLSTCDEPYLVDCDTCPVTLERIRKLLAAVAPVIEEEVRSHAFRAGWKVGYGQGRDDEAAGLPVADHAPRHAADWREESR